MANLFRQIGIYSAQGQLYEPEDIGSVLYYREARDGQILEEGITEAGAIVLDRRRLFGERPAHAAVLYLLLDVWLPAHRRPDLGRRRPRTRGFLVGATSGRTTLGGEGLQHQDGSSHLTAATVPNCRAHDPAYAYEGRRDRGIRHAPHAGRATRRVLPELARDGREAERARLLGLATPDAGPACDSQAP